MNTLRVILVVLAVCVMGARVPEGSLSSLDAKSTNVTNAYSSTSLYSPSGLTATTQGHSVALSWTAPANAGNGNGYTVQMINNGTNGATPCPSSDTSYTTWIGGTAAVSYTDSSTNAVNPEGSFACYLVRTGYNPAGGPPWGSPPPWISANSLPTAKTRIGVVAVTVTMTNGGTANQLDQNDTIVIDFNQPMTPTSFAGQSVCARISDNTIYLAQTATLTCGTTYALGKITGGTLTSFLSLDGVFNATYAWSNGNSRMTVTIGTNAAGGAVTLSSATRTLTPAAALTSSSGGFGICTANPVGGLCLPTTSSRP